MNGEGPVRILFARIAASQALPPSPLHPHTEDSMRTTLLLRAFAVAALAAALAHVPAASAPSRTASRNLLANPGFEQGAVGSEWMPAAWDTSSAGLETVFFGRDSFLVRSGRFCVNVANTSTLYWMGHNWSQTILVGREAWGKTAVFSVWTRSNGLDGRAYIMAQAYTDTISKMAVIWGVPRDEAMSRMNLTAVRDPFRDLAWQRTQFEDPQTEWVRREARVVVKPGTNVIFVRCGLLGTGQVLFDDASLTLESTPAPVAAAPGRNLLGDPGFENGALAWEWAIPPFEGARIDRDTTVYHGGRTSMRCSNLRDGVVTSRAGMCQPIPAEALRGKRVRVGAWLRGDSLTAAAYVMIVSHSLKGKTQSGTTGLFTDSFDWTYTQTELDIPRDAELVWAWVMLNAPVSGTLWIDDASFEVVGPAESAHAKPASPAPRRKP